MKIKTRGSFAKTQRFLKRAGNVSHVQILHRYGREGVAALASTTPSDSGETAQAWSYEITKSKYGYKLEFINTNVVNGVPVVILLQYGHRTGNGGYVRGIDFINPTLEPIFKKIANEAWREVTSA